MRSRTVAAQDRLAEWYQALPAGHAAALARVAGTLECCAEVDAEIPDREYVPTDEELWGLEPDPDSDPPDGAEAWLTELPADLRNAYLDAVHDRGMLEALPAGGCRAASVTGQASRPGRRRRCCRLAWSWPDWPDWPALSGTAGWPRSATMS